MKAIYRFLLFTGITAILLGSTIDLQAAGVPESPYLEVIEKESNNGYPLIFHIYTDTTGAAADEFILYRAAGDDPDPDEFEEVKRIKASGNNLKYTITIIEDDNSEMLTFYATALNDEGESTPGNKVTVFKGGGDEEEDYVKIYSNPRKTAYLGKEYTYKVMAKSNVKCPILYELVDTPPDMEIDKNTGLIKWTPEETGEYGVMIKAYLECDEEVIDTQEFSITVKEDSIGNDKPYVHIISRPDPVGYVGKEYSHTIQTKTNIRCPSVFEWKVYAENEEPLFEGTTAEIKFTPEEAGKFVIYIKATLECDEDVYDEKTFPLVIKEEANAEECAMIKGKVYIGDENTDPPVPVKTGVIAAWHAEKMDKNTDGRPVYKASIKEGVFELEVPDGKYYLEISGPGFLDEWYEDAESLENAVLIEIECEEKVEITAYVEPMPEPEYYTVSGQVYSAETDELVTGKVRFFPVGWMNNHKDDEHPDKRVWETNTDESGNYSIELPDTYSYFAQAVPDKNTGYLPQYYDRVYSPFEADILVLESDLEGIDFPLKSEPEFQNGFTGIMKNTDDEALQGKVIAYLVIPNNNDKDKKYKYSRTAETDEEGLFMFSNLIPGEYVLLSIPDDITYIPGYYVLGDVVTQKWREADKIEVDEATIDLVFECIHEQKGDKEGILQAKGKVRRNGGSIEKAGGDNPLSGDYIPGAFVTAVNDLGIIVDYISTDENGSFLLSDLGESEYILNFDKVGFDSESTIINTDYGENKILELDIAMEEEAVSSVDEFLIEEDFMVYPVPANDKLNIEFHEMMNDAAIKIINGYGAEVYSGRISGTSAFVDIRSLSQGMYYLVIENNGKSASVKIPVVR